MSKHRFLTIGFTTLLLCSLISSLSWGLIVHVTDPNANNDNYFFADGTNPCPRETEPGVWADCYVRSYVSGQTANQFNPIFSQGWDAWNNSQPENGRWTLEQGDTLYGTLNIFEYSTFNLCPATGGVQVQASFTPFEYEDGSRELDAWYWCQAIYYNYEVGPIPPHDTEPVPPRYRMDVMTTTGWLPPIYPYQYPDGSFYDRPGAGCLEDSTVFFDAVALICWADWNTRVLTVYEGFSYGWKFTCQTPEPASVIGLVALGLPMLLLRLNPNKKTEP